MKNSNLKGEIRETLPKFESRQRKVELSQNPFLNHALRGWSNYILKGFKKIGRLEKIGGKEHKNPYRD